MYMMYRQETAPCVSCTSAILGDRLPQMQGCTGAANVQGVLISYELNVSGQFAAQQFSGCGIGKLNTASHVVFRYVAGIVDMHVRIVDESGLIGSLGHLCQQLGYTVVHAGIVGVENHRLHIVMFGHEVTLACTAFRCKSRSCKHECYSAD